MNDTARWVVGIVLVLLLVGFVAFARGRVHHRGQAVGEHALARPAAALVGGGHE